MVIVRGISTDPETQVGFYGDLHQVSHQYHEMVEGRVLAQRRIVRLPRIQRTRSPEPYVKYKKKSKGGLSHYRKQNAEATRNLLQQMGEKV